MSYPDDYISTSELVKTGYYQLNAVHHKTDGTKYLLKKFFRVDTQQVAALRSGVELMRELRLDMLLEPVELFEQGVQASILYADFPAISLRRFLEQKKTIPEHLFLKIAKSLTQLLAGFHSRGWIIKNLSPENILLNVSDYSCKLSDLRTATRIFKKEQQLSQKQDILEIRYYSPEQTGRISQITDFRADLYALGVILYELITGRPPFDFTDPVEIIHAHLAIPPVEPMKIRTDFPRALNDIVMKLLSKSPEERYQGCEGLLFDLDNSEKNLSPSESFKLGTKDRVSKIVPTSKMIGRRDEIFQMEKAYESSRKGKKQAVYIRGYSGVGKTRVVREFHRNKLTDRVPIVNSKFDTLQRGTPYSALLEAMKSLIRKILLDEDDKVYYWKNRLNAYLRNNGNIIAEVIPELEILTGKLEPVNPLPPDESQKRFQQTFISFISCFTSDDHSLILFLDDLQWADIASLRLIELILMDESIKNFLFIGAYRENEVDATHPLSLSLAKQEKWVPIVPLQILPLRKDQTSELIIETLHYPVVRSNEFVERIFQKTGGNVFFTLQLLTSLFEEKLLYRDEEGIWQWNEKLLQDASVSANVVDFLVEKINNLSPRLQELLRTAACLGDIFDLNTLASIVAEKRNVVAMEIASAVNMGYIVSLDEHLDAFFKMVSDINEMELAKFANTRLRFSHDRIRQAALVLVNDHDRALINLKAARIKTTSLSAVELEEEVFFIANHYNAAGALLTDESEIKEKINFNHKAGSRAKNASAYDAAIQYFDSAKAHLDFQHDYQKLYDIYLQQSECRYLSGKYAEAEKDLDILFRESHTPLEKLNALFIKVYLYNIQDKKKEAIEAGRTGYRLYNIYMPRNKAFTLLLVLKDVLTARIMLPEKNIPALLERPQMKDPELIRLQEFMLAMAPTIYQYDQNLFAWNFMRQFFASMKYGNNGISSICFIGYGMLVSQLFGKYHMGKKLADVALALNNQLGYTALKWKVRLSYYNFVHHWTEPIRPEIDQILEVENGAYANGDPIFAGYAIFIYHQKKFALGYPLNTLQESFENYLRLVDQRHDVETRRFLEGYLQSILCLRGIEKDTLTMGNYNAPQVLNDSIQSSSFTVAADTFIAYMSTLYLFGHYEEAAQRYEEGKKYMAFIQQRYEFAEFNFYGALICAKAVENRLAGKTKFLKALKGHVDSLKKWSGLCAANFEPQYLIAAGELARVDGRIGEVLQIFEQAIQSAEQYGFVNYKALALELAGRFQFSSGNTIIAQTYLDYSRKAWHQWGADAKVMQIEKTFSTVLRDTILEQQTADELQDTTFAGMDLKLLLKATRAVNSEKDIDSLVEQLMKAIIQYSGADTGYLLVKTGPDFIVKAKYSALSGMQTHDLYADNDTLPMSIIRYVIRLKEPLILNQPAQSSDYSNTAYFEKFKPKSLIAYPILKQGEIFGALYLENFQQESVFDEKKINILSLISAQAAVSLDNAFLYENLESRVLERTVAIELEKGKVDEMLENILPKASIEELKRTGKTTAQKFDNTTVLIADIKGFTKIAERLTPEELIKRIDFYFRSFDEIMQKHKLEKIKTIGDAYVAIGGLDGDKEVGAVSMVAAALDMQDCIIKENEGKPEEEKLEMRIGIHSGSVIAGVVGIKKFQYDIWGDTVNIAARMEQESVPGRINISSETYQLTKDKVATTYRGKIEAKNKGPMDMYFVDHLL